MGKYIKLQLVIIVFFLCNTTLIAQDNKVIDSLKTIFIKTTENNDKCKLLNNIALSYSLTNYDSSLKYAGTALMLSKEINNINEEGKAMKILGGIYFFQGKYKEAMYFYIESLNIYIKTGNNKEKAGAYNNIGNIYYYQGNYDKCIEYYKLAVEIYRQENDMRGIAQTLYNIANIYQDSKENFEEAKKYMEQSLEIFEKVNNKKGIAYALNGLGNIYDILNKNSESIKYYEKALELFRLIEDKKGQSSTIASLGTLYLKTGETKKAINYLNDALIIAIEIGTQDLQMQIYQALAEIYYNSGDYKKSIYNYKSFNLLKDTLTNKENMRIVSDMEAKYNSKLKQQKIEKQNLELAKRNSEIKQQNLEKWTFIIGFLMMVIISFIIFFNYRNKKKMNIILINKKNEIEENLKYTQKLQEALKHDLSHYMQLSLKKIINPHFIFNSLNSIQSFILQNNKLEASIYLSKFADLMRKILEQSQNEFITLKDEIDAMNLYIELESKRFDEKFTWKFIVEEGINPEKVLLPPLISQPFIENAIWHGLMHKDKDRELLISLKLAEKELLYSIEDNGVGREKSAELNKNTKKHESNGIKITAERLKIINSLDNNDLSLKYIDLKNENGEAIGTRVEIILPLKQTINYD